MLLGKVIGEVWGTKVDQAIESRKLLVIEPVGESWPGITAGHVVAVDTVDAGVGDHVIVAFGSPARTCYDGMENYPFETAVMGIVDHAEVLSEKDIDIPQASFISVITHK